MVRQKLFWDLIYNIYAVHTKMRFKFAHIQSANNPLFLFIVIYCVQKLASTSLLHRLKVAASPSTSFLALKSNVSITAAVNFASRTCFHVRTLFYLNFPLPVWLAASVTPLIFLLLGCHYFKLHVHSLIKPNDIFFMQYRLSKLSQL